MSSPGDLRVDSCRSALIDGGLETWPTSGATPRAHRGCARALEGVGGHSPGKCCYRPRAPITLTARERDTVEPAAAHTAMRGTASIVAAIVCAALAIAGAIDEDAKAILKLEEVVSPDSHKLVTSSISSPQPGQVLCSNTCKYSHDQSITRGAVCDDGGPGHASSECPLGTDCEDCGERVVTASTIATHRLLQSSPNPVVNGGVPICTCCAAIYWHEGGRICEVVPLWELSDWTCRVLVSC